MTPEIARALREPFPREKIGKLPRVTCGDCRDSRSRICDKHAKSRCDECGSYITSAHIHLDFVGHADITDRLLESDPEWSWEPFALDQRGLPAIDENGGMWIRLTVAGVTRIGYGHADDKRGGNAVKETIGDSLRNASMRFGVALDLWRKETHVDESTGPRQERPAPTREPVVAQPATPEQVAEFESLSAEIAAVMRREDIGPIGGRVKHAQAEGFITASQYRALGVKANERIAELQQAEAA